MCSLLRLTLLQPPFAALGRSFVTTLFVRRFSDDARYTYRSSLLVHGNEGQVTGVGVPAATREQLLGFDPHADFHGGLADVIHARLHHDEIADENRLAQSHPHGRGREVPRRT